MNNDQQFNINKKNEYTFSDLYLALARGMKWIVLTPIILSLITLIYLIFFTQPMYESSTTFFPSFQDGSTNNSSLLNIASKFGVAIPSQFEQTDFLSADMYPAIVKSRALAIAVLNKKFVFNNLDNEVSLLNILTEPGDYEKSDTSKVIANKIKYFTEDVVKIKQNPDTPLYTLYTLAEDPVLSAQIANAVIEKLDTLQMEFKSKKVLQKKDFVEDRIVDIEKELRKSENALQKFREQNKQIDYSPALLLEQERLERETQVQTEIYISLKQQYESVKIEEVQETSFIQILDEPNIPTKPSKPRKLLILIFTFAGSFALGILIAIIKESHRIQKTSNDRSYIEANKVLKGFFRFKK